MRIFEVEGDSVEEIISQFTKQQNIPADYISYEVIEQGSKGLFGIGKKNTKVKITYNEAECVKKKAKLMLNELLEKAGFTDAHVSVEENDKRLLLNIETEQKKIRKKEGREENKRNNKKNI